jgi:hypothetical protein
MVDEIMCPNRDRESVSCDRGARNVVGDRVRRGQAASSSAVFLRALVILAGCGAASGESSVEIPASVTTGSSVVTTTTRAPVKRIVTPTSAAHTSITPTSRPMTIAHTALRLSNLR